MAIAKRYKAEWIAKEYRDQYDEREPDLDEYGSSYHASKEQAEQAAIVAGQKADQGEWINVAEQELRVKHGWVTVRRWTGDYQGLFQEIEV